VPIIHYSVEWWATLHQGPTIAKLADPSISASMLVPLLAMIAAFTFAFAWLLMQHARSELLARERDKSWVRELAAA
jgi:heme exporter protein C